jgi:hypothetical protein
MFSHESLRRLARASAFALATALFSGCWYSGDGTAIATRAPEAGTRREADGGGAGTDASVTGDEVDDAGAEPPDAANEADAIPDAGATPDAADAAISHSDTRWRFAVVADTRDNARGYNRTVFPRLLEAVLREHERSAIDLMLVPGDLVYGSADVLVELAGWAEAVRSLQEAGITVYPVRGNHEIQCDQECWNRVFTGSSALPDDGPPGEEGLTYSFSHKNAFFVGFDNYSGQKVNVEWVQERLADNTLPHVFSFSHEPAFAAYHLGCLDDFVEERDRFWAALERAGSRVYFCGHDHFYDHAHVLDGDGDENDDIHQFIVGSGGGPLYSFSPPYPGDNSGMTLKQIDHAETYGYLVVEVDDLDVTLTWMELETGAGASWSYTVKA